MNTLKDAGETVTRGVYREKVGRLTSRVDESTAGFKSEAADRIEALAGQIRSLGESLGTPDEAWRVVRELERTADYLRFRRSSDMVSDAGDFLRGNPAIWVAGALLGGVLVFAILRRREE